MNIHYIRWIPGPAWIAGITLPGLGIFIEKAYMDDPVLHYHELWHVHQYRAMGLLAYCVGYVWETLRHGYRGNRFEQAAYRQSAGKTWQDVNRLKASL